MEPILSRENPRVKEYVKLNSGKQARKKLQKFTLEGTRLCREALHSGIAIEHAFAAEEWLDANPELLDELKQKNIPVFAVPDTVEKKLAETNGPQGIYFVCPLLPQTSFSALAEKKRILCLYDIQDPGNLGTMVRSADALGFEAVVLSTGTCDFFSQKVMRAAMGSAFRLPFYIADDMYAFEAEMKRQGLVSAAAVVGERALQVGCCILPEIHLLYIGNEGNGLPPDFAAACSHRVTLPMNGHAESLNAAVSAGILMWELTK